MGDRCLIMPCLALFVLSCVTLQLSPCAGVPHGHRPAPHVSHRCTSLEDATSMCVYHKSLCYSKQRGFAILVPDASMDGVDVDKDDTLPPPPMHAGWDVPDAAVHGPPHWRASSIPYRSFIQAPVRYRHADAFSASENVTNVGGWTAVLAFDADNFNLYHWAATVYAAFVARLKHVERVGTARFDAAKTMQRLLQGRGYDTVLALRGPPTDWQQNYADILLGVKDHPTRYLYDGDVPVDDDFVCYDRAVVAGAALYVSSSIANAQLVRRMAASVKGVPYPAVQGLRASFAITWTVRHDKRRIVNMEDALQATRRAMAWFEDRHGGKVSLDVVNWSEDDPFMMQATQMAHSRILITTHGSSLNHAMFMDTGSLVIEINAHQFRYDTGDVVVLLQGHHYTRYAASLADTRHQGHSFGSNPFPEMGGGTCNRSPECLSSQRDADIRIDVERWEELMKQSLDAVV